MRRDLRKGSWWAVSKKKRIQHGDITRRGVHCQVSGCVVVVGQVWWCRWCMWLDTLWHINNDDNLTKLVFWRRTDIYYRSRGSGWPLWTFGFQNSQARPSTGPVWRNRVLWLETTEDLSYGTRGTRYTVLNRYEFTNDTNPTVRYLYEKGTVEYE